MTYKTIEKSVQFLLLKNPIKFVGDENGSFTGVVVTDMQLGEPDASGRRRSCNGCRNGNTCDGCR